MNYEIRKVSFIIKDSTWLIMNNIIHFKILNLLGKGSVGSVYLLVENKNYFIIKIANKDCNEYLLDEIQTIKKLFKKYEIINRSYPKFYGEIGNNIGIIYPYFGFYNLKSIKSTNYNINNKHKIQIIRQIIEQMITFNNVIHCDINSSNIVIDIKFDRIISTIVDFGLMKENKENIISSCYITSPESLLTLDKYKSCISDYINIMKHDYYGLFSIIIDLFSRKTFWSNMIFYFTNIIGIDCNIFNSEDCKYIFVYCWYKFYYSSIDELPNNTFKKLISSIEENIINKDNFISFDIFIDNIEIENKYMRDFLKKLIHFNPDQRPSLDELLDHKFLCE